VRRSGIMKQDDENGSQTLFSASSVVSDSKPWFVSLFDRLRESRHSKTNPQICNVTAAPVPVAEIWTEHPMVGPRMLSLALHVAILSLAVIPVAMPPKPLPKSIVRVALSSPLITPIADKSGGGGGGGKRTQTPSSLGKSPKP